MPLAASAQSAAVGVGAGIGFRRRHNWLHGCGVQRQGSIGMAGTVFAGGKSLSVSSTSDAAVRLPWLTVARAHPAPQWLTGSGLAARPASVQRVQPAQEQVPVLLPPASADSAPSRQRRPVRPVQVPQQQLVLKLQGEVSPQAPLNSHGSRSVQSWLTKRLSTAVGEQALGSLPSVQVTYGDSTFTAPGSNQQSSTGASSVSVVFTDGVQTFGLPAQFRSRLSLPGQVERRRFQKAPH